MCGLVFKAKYLEKRISLPSSDARNLGIWFEYWATSAMPAYPDPAWPVDPVHGIQMPPINYSLTGLKKIPAVYEMLTPFQRAKRQAENFKHYIQKLGIEIIACGERVMRDDCSGVLDIRALYKGVEIIIDLKYTGLIDDKWNDLGWEKLSLPSKWKNTVQAYHYKYITGLPFFWMLFDSGADLDAKFYEARISDDSMLYYEKTLNDKREILKQDIRNGFRAYPTLKDCMDCPLAAECRHRVTYPIPETIHL